MTVSNQPEQTSAHPDPQVDAAVSAASPEAAPAEVGVETPATAPGGEAGRPSTDARTTVQGAPETEVAATEAADSSLPEAVGTDEGDKARPVETVAKVGGAVLGALTGALGGLVSGGDRTEDAPAPVAGGADDISPDTQEEAERVASSEGAEPVVVATQDASEEAAPRGDAKPAGTRPAETSPQPAGSPTTPDGSATADGSQAQAESTSEAKPAPRSASVARPGVPSPAAIKPSPAAMPRPAAATPATVTAPPTTTPSNAATFGRVAEDGTVFVRTPDGERAVGSYPGASAEDALAYFARKYDEMWAAAELLYHRVLQTGLSAKEATDDLTKLREHVGEANVVGDLPQLDAKIESIATAIEARRQVEATERAAAREQARTEREAIVAEAERIAAQDPAKTQWKTSGTRIRELLDEWKQHQRTSAKLDRETENALWQRFSHARNSFDKARRVYFAELESTQTEAKATKERLVAEAEKLSTSTEWGQTAGAYKRLMDQWRQAGRAGRKDDDALWARFKAAQDAFFNAKDAQSAEEDKEFRANLEVKEGLLAEARALLPITDLAAAKSTLRTIQDRWDAAGKVPRSEMGRIEGELRKVEQAVRDAEDARWKKSNPEVNHRASAFAEQIEKALEKENKALERAKATGDATRIKKAEENLAARRQLLEMVQRAQS
ncbi:DUF349 domain-containing protein [Arsenicicoccus dermatophilus]|uniref:DUF349 domain-containing protein n=1 Tax=Arsenicicoccus dermatophilus TaxID=1076331 RepID=UPI001F4CED9F|nr:DUF349 domain-containing protein [Arsenicicoccus dermatophilus]MCH8613022.1 DUF349 domain-containing protein [Arsenicicoccus dermatophilus]